MEQRLRDAYFFKQIQLVLVKWTTHTNSCLEKTVKITFTISNVIIKCLHICRQIADGGGYFTPNPCAVALDHLSVRRCIHL